MPASLYLFVFHCISGHLRKAAHGDMAEREGFEPSIRFCRILTFQASAFDHSATAPHRWKRGA